MIAKDMTKNIKIQEVAEALEKARVCFHGLAAAIATRQEIKINLQNIHNLLQENNIQAGEMLQKLQENGQWSPHGKRKENGQWSPLYTKKKKKPKGSRFDLIAYQMMKGGFAQMLDRNQVATSEEIVSFKKIHASTIKWVEEHMPKRINAGVMGAVGKAVLWYGREKMLSFMEQLQTLNFHGKCDPAHVLYLWVNKNTNKDARQAYRRTVTAIRAYISGKKKTRIRDGQEYVGYIIPSKTDIFEWDNTYTIMIPPKVVGEKAANSRNILDEITNQ